MPEKVAHFQDNYILHNTLFSPNNTLFLVLGSHGINKYQHVAVFSAVMCFSLHSNENRLQIESTLRRGRIVLDITDYMFRLS